MLFQGFFLAFLGSVILLGSGTLLSLSLLQTWGGIIFCIGLGLITLGLLPYRRFASLQMHPHRLILVNNDQVMFFIKSKRIFTLSLCSITKMCYKDRSKNYGIVIWIKTSPNSLIVDHQALKEFQQLSPQFQTIDKGDLFLPYFNQQAYNELKEWLEAITEEKA